MAATIIDSGRKVFANLKALIFTPWTNESTPGSVSYDLVNIVADTTSVEQADNEVNTIDHEFSNVPLYENVTLGDKTFSCECIDFQNTVLKTLMGWVTLEENDDDIFAPIAYKDLYCTIEMQFSSTESVVVLPKVKLNSKALFSSMKTDASRGTITGTCYSAFIEVGNKSIKTDQAIIGKTNAVSYKVKATNTNTSVGS